mmetsp:Transcript_43914/g.113701  ORF Transcript_43914/g.113701 Transcript_43914/m.113701 type:complete len:325 (-) Transcript_43914:88-1062(-)|eukprot:jgi/Tetstr1/446131/TSEL_033731.t1
MFSAQAAAVAAAALAFGLLMKRPRKKTVVVMGATTDIGAAVVRALRKDGRFRIHAVITDPAMYDIKVPGCAKCVAANRHDPFSLNRAMIGADFAFLAVDSEGLEPDQYATLAKKLADAARGADLEHCVWYSMEGPDALNGVPKTGLPQLEAEVSAARYARSTGMRMTVVAGSLPFEAILCHAKLTLDKRAHLVTLPLGGVPVPSIAMESVGKCVAVILGAPILYATRTLTLATEKHTMREYCDILSKVTGKHFAYNEVGNDVFSMVAGNEPLGSLCAAITDRNKPHCLARATGTAAKLSPDLVSFEKWAKQAISPRDAAWAQDM